MKVKIPIIFLLLVAFGLSVGYVLGGKLADNRETRKKQEEPKLQYSYFSNKTFFDNAYKDVSENTNSRKDIKGLIVNHHLLASNLIAEAMNSIATDSPVTVILISPNHFSSGNGQIISSLSDWQTPYGIIKNDADLIKKLKESDAINIDEYPFKKEHGISGIVPFIKKSLPNSKIVPIIVKENVSDNDIDKFTNSLYEIVGDNVILVGSFDFSHIYPNDITLLNDKKSISAITNFDFDSLNSIEIDSRKGIKILLKYMQKIDAGNFNLIKNTNSSQILNDPNIKEVVSYITGTFTNN